MIGRRLLTGQDHEEQMLVMPMRLEDMMEDCPKMKALGLKCLVQ